jgi:hypothetical protein
MKQRSHLIVGLAFIGVCVLIGVGLFVFTILPKQEAAGNVSNETAAGAGSNLATPAGQSAVPSLDYVKTSGLPAEVLARCGKSDEWLAENGYKTQDSANKFFVECARERGAKKETESIPSEFRNGVSVESLYRQDLGNGYSTTWLGRLEKQDGPWRDVYVETNEKFSTKGVLSFRCDQNNVAWVTYDDDQFGSPSNQHVTNVAPSEFEQWQAGTLDKMAGEDPPFQVYRIARSKFC